MLSPAFSISMRDTSAPRKALFKYFRIAKSSRTCLPYESRANQRANQSRLIPKRNPNWCTFCPMIIPFLFERIYYDTHMTRSLSINVGTPHRSCLEIAEHRSFINANVLDHEIMGFQVV